MNDAGWTYAGWVARLMLVIALLPWGAYQGALRGPSTSAPTRTAGMIEAAAQLQTMPPAGQAALLAQQPRRCKTAVLIGTPCAPDAVLASGPRLTPPRPEHSDRPLRAWRLAALLPEPPPRRPPRAA